MPRQPSLTAARGGPECCSSRASRGPAAGAGSPAAAPQCPAAPPARTRSYTSRTAATRWGRGLSRKRGELISEAFGKTAENCSRLADIEETLRKLRRNCGYQLPPCSEGRNTVCQKSFDTPSSFVRGCANPRPQSHVMAVVMVHVSVHSPAPHTAANVLRNCKPSGKPRREATQTHDNQQEGGTYFSFAAENIDSRTQQF